MGERGHPPAQRPPLSQRTGFPERAKSARTPPHRSKSAIMDAYHAHCAAGQSCSCSVALATVLVLVIETSPYGRANI